MGLSISSAEWAIIGGMAAAIAAMALYFVNIHKIHREEQKDNITNMISAMAGTTKALEGNTEVLKEVKSLIQTVNERQIKNDAKNGKHDEREW